MEPNILVFFTELGQGWVIGERSFQRFESTNGSARGGGALPVAAGKVDRDRNLQQFLLDFLGK